MKTMTIRALGVLFALTISVPAVAWSQERAGVATAVVGTVTVTHVAMPPAPLNFKDDVLLNDRIATGDKAFARVLLGGKAVVTAREYSIMTITEVPGTSTIDLLSGRISVAVDKSKMRAGDLVQIKTPNAVAGIRGTIVIADARKNSSTITVLRGLVDVYRRDPATGNAFGPAVAVGVREAITVNANVLPARPQPISVDTARQLSNDFTPPVRSISPERTTSVSDEVTRATDLINVLAPAAKPVTKEAAPARDALTTKGETTDKSDKLDQGAKLDRADRLDRAADKLEKGDRLDRLTDRLDRAGDKLDNADKFDRADKLDRATDKLDRAVDRLDRATDRLDRGDKLDKGMASVPGTSNALPATGALPTGTPSTPITMPVTGGPTNSLPALQLPTTVPTTLPTATLPATTLPTLVGPTVAPTMPQAPISTIPINPGNLQHINRFKK